MIGRRSQCLFEFGFSGVAILKSFEIQIPLEWSRILAPSLAIGAPEFVDKFVEELGCFFFEHREAGCRGMVGAILFEPETFLCHESEDEKATEGGAEEIAGGDSAIAGLLADHLTQDPEECGCEKDAREKENGGAQTNQMHHG